MSKKAPRKKKADETKDVLGKWVASVVGEEPKVSVYHANVLAMARAIVGGRLVEGASETASVADCARQIVDEILAMPVHAALAPKVHPEGLATFVTPIKTTLSTQVTG